MTGLTGLSQRSLELGCRNGLWNWAVATVSGTGYGKKRWFFGVALRTCISLVRRGALREGVPDTSLKGFRCGTSAAKLLWNKCGEVVVATGAERYTKCTGHEVYRRPPWFTIQEAGWEKFDPKMVWDLSGWE